MPEIHLSLKLTGSDEFEDLLTQIRDDYGPKDANQILKKAVQDAMVPV